MSDWGGYRAIIDEAREIKRALEEKALSPVECPKCGSPLQENPRTKVKGCPMGHWRSDSGEPLK